MKNKLLITTALVAIFSATNVCASGLVVSEGETVTNKDLTITEFLSENNRPITNNIGDLKVESGTLDTKGIHIDAGEIMINSGTIKLDDSTLTNHGLKVTINSGKINLNNHSDFGGGEITISGNSILNLDNSSALEFDNKFIQNGGSLNLNNSRIEIEPDDDSLSEFTINAGTINLKNKSHILNGNFSDIDDSTSKLSATDATVKGEGIINVISDNNYMFFKNLNLDGTLNIEKDATLYISKGFTAKNNTTIETADKDEAGTIILGSTGRVNLSGLLDANINGNGALNIKSSNALVDGNVTGSNVTFEADHSLSKAVSGTIGDLAALNVNKGTLTYDKATGKIGNLNVTGGLDIGTNTVKATNVDFKDNSKLALRVSGADNYGQINANTIKIGNDTTMNVTLDNGVVANGENAKFKFLNGTVNGDFMNKITENSRYAIEWVDDGSLSITGQATASDVVADAGGSATNAATAEAWDSVSSSPTASEGAKAVASALGDLSQNATTPAGQKAYVDALTAVAPDAAPAVQQTSAETANQVFGAVSTRLTGGSISTGGEGMASGDNIFKRGAMWVQGLFNKSKLDDTSKAKGFDADSNGIAFGAEKFVTDDTKVGIGYAYTNTDIDGFMRDTDVDTHTAILYGEYKPSNWYVNGIATYGWSDYEESKSVAGVGVKADYDVETFGLQAMTGYDMNVNGLGITPEAGLRYVHIKQNAYKDSADQRVSANDSDILTGVIGAKVSKNFELSNGMNIKPEARIAATYDLFNDDVNSVVTLANGSAYAVEGEALDRFGMEFGAGVTAEVNDNVELSLGYEGKFRQDYQDHTGLINAKYKF